MKDIIQSWFLYLFYSWGLIKDEDLDYQIKHRLIQCCDCPLNQNGWCSKKRKVKVHYTLKFSKLRKEKIVKGCGCYLKAKFFSKYKEDSCPLKKWKM